MNVLLNAYASIPPSPAHDRVRSCDLIADLAFGSHEACYMGNGFCRMIGHCRNIQASFQTAEIRDVFPFVSPFYRQTLTLASLHACNYNIEVKMIFDRICNVHAWVTCMIHRACYAAGLV